MLGTRSYKILGAALVACLAAPLSAAEVSAAQYPTHSVITVTSAKVDPCDGRGHGCPLGYEDGLADGRRCIARRPGHSPDSSKPDYSVGYAAGYDKGSEKCGDGKPHGQSKKAQLREAGAAQGAADAAERRCKRSSLAGKPKPYKVGYRRANPFC
ncbi:hypothetical protein GCM10012278_32260 [Nonomuraea glycinis]|uniref:Uncharacterized protein n=1 Tax=Nonomuraea glycinis TaxID=2047744 RepID=A0A918E6F6_9ACTN|nr:hypothetical protein GCM10012278_32260 [Nonomuraea glycinis]